MLSEMIVGPVLLSLGLLGPTSDGPTPIRFKADVAPILVRKCLACHQDSKVQGGLNLSTVALLKAGGKTAGTDILSPGDPEASHLIATIRADAQPRMPYKSPPLSPREIAVLERWVKEGATFDGLSETETQIASLVNPLDGLPKIPLTASTLDACTSVEFSPKTDHFAASTGKQLLIFDKEGVLQTTLSDHPGPLTYVGYTPEGRTLIAAGGRPGMFGSVVLWDVASSRKSHDLRGHTDAILSSAVSPDGSLLATASYDRTVILWELATGRNLRTLKEHTDAIHAVAFSPDGKTIATASADRTVKVWDVASGKKLFGFGDSTAELYAMAFAPDGQTLYAAGVDRSIHVWAIPSQTFVRSVFAHDAPIIRLLVSTDGKTMVSAGEDRKIKFWALPSLEASSVLPEQSDWPMATALLQDKSRILVGRFDGTISLLSTTDGTPVLSLRDRDGTVKNPKPVLSRDASLNPLSPRLGVRGSLVSMTLNGTGVGRATRLIFTEPGLTGTLKSRPSFDENAIDAELTIAADARPGIHRIAVESPLGISPSQPFVIAEESPLQEKEPNDQVGQILNVPLPSILVGVIDRPGDRDVWQFDAKAGDEIVAELGNRALGTSLNAAITVRNAKGDPVARSASRDGLGEVDLIFRSPSSETFTLDVEDQNFAGSGNHAYWIRLGRFSRLKSVFPLGFQADVRTAVALKGANLSSWLSSGLSVSPTNDFDIVDVPLPPSSNLFGSLTPKVVATRLPVSIETENSLSWTEENPSPDRAQKLEARGGVSGVIAAPGDQDVFEFAATKGKRVIVEVFARRLGSTLDSFIEILDDQGRPVPRALLEPVEKTHLAFRDHPSGGRTIRLTEWAGFRERDYILMGRELAQIEELPRNPDDDALMWGTGVARAGGERIGLLETTPEHHHLGQSLYKVRLHPPGTNLPNRGVAPILLNYLNDDGGPSYGKDSRLTFDPPSDGRYFVRVLDSLGGGGPDHGYHLVVREPKPDFRLELSRQDVNINRGGTSVIQVNATRLDGFNGPIDLKISDLPEGLLATPSRIEPEGFTATIGFSSIAGDQHDVPFAKWSLTGICGPIQHTLAVNGSSSGSVTVTTEPNLSVRFPVDSVTIRPGERVDVRLSVERSAAFSGRVPIEVRNLPRGVRVLNLGLNGILVTEKETERTISFFAEEWVEPTDRPFFAIGKCEAVGTEHASLAIRLLVKPRSNEDVTSEQVKSIRRNDAP